MSVILELSSRNYLEDRLGVKRALSHMETLCGEPGGYELGEPKEMAGWTFFRLRIGPGLHACIESRFSDMLSRYRWSKPDEKFRRFLAEYLEARGCPVRVRSAP